LWQWQLWDVENQKAMSTFRENEAAVNSVAFHPRWVL